ncbi:MAG TPA: hypothetical protein VNX65_03160 [Patescibacteria group bacterium]|jgi:hypothetical protein|nr:hypothetical protein [Patescibacteria group bacterium]
MNKINYDTEVTSFSEMLKIFNNVVSKLLVDNGLIREEITEQTLILQEEIAQQCLVLRKEIVEQKR